MRRRWSTGSGPIHPTERYLPWGDFDHSLPAHKQDADGRPTCDTCHRVVDSAGSSQAMLPRIEQCATCHGKTKAWETTQAASGDCAECQLSRARNGDPEGGSNAGVIRQRKARVLVQEVSEL